MKTKQLMEMMRQISPRYTEEAAARAAAAKPRASFLPAIGLTAGVLMCTVVIGGAIYAGRRPADLRTEETSFAAEESAAEYTATDATGLPAAQSTGAVTEIAAVQTDTAEENENVPSETTLSGTEEAAAQTTARTEAKNDIFTLLRNLDYAPVTCDGLPEFQVTAPDGTLYLLNFSSHWVWQDGKDVEAYLPDNLINGLIAMREQISLQLCEWNQTPPDEPQEDVTTELLGDIDGDGYLTYADYMLAWMYQYYLTLPETKGSYPQMLSAAQIAQYNRLGELAVDLSQVPADAQEAATPALRLDAAVTSLMQPVDLSSLAGRIVQYPAEYGNITDEDRESLITGQYQTLADHAYLMGQYYILQFLPEKYGESVTSITSAQVDSYIEFLRTACIERYAELAKQPQSTLPGDVDGDGYLTYADYLLLQLYADYQHDVFCHGDSALHDCPDDYAFRLTEEQAARGDLISEPSERYIEAQNGYLNTPEAKMPESMKTIPAIGDNDCDALLEKLKEIYGNGDDTIKAADVRDYFKEHPEQYGDVTEIDMLVAEHGCYADMAFFRLRIMCWNYWVTLSGDEFNIGFGIVGPSTDAQVEAYLEFLRTSCIAILKKPGS